MWETWVQDLGSRPGFDPWVGKIPWKRERLPTPVFWPGEFHGLYSPWGHKESDTTEWLSLLSSVYLPWRNMSIQILCPFLIGLSYIDMSQPRVYTCSPSRIPFPPPSLSHPPGSSQCTSPEHPVSCIEPGPQICFTNDNIHVSTLPSQIIPSSPSPTESKRLFFTSVSLLLSRIQGYHYHLSKSIYMH